MAAGKLPAYGRRLCTVKHCEPRLCGTHLEVLFVVLRDEGRRHLLKAVPKHFRSRMRLALDSRLPWALVLALQQIAQMQDHYPVRCLFFGSCCYLVIDQRGARAARRRGTDAPRAPGVFLVSPYHLGVKASAAVGRPRLNLRHQPSVRLASDSGDASEQSGWAQPLVQIRAPGRRLPCSPAEDIAGAGLPIWIVQIHRRAQLTVTAQLRPHDTR